MKLVAMSTIRARHPTRPSLPIVIAGGWKAHVAQIFPDADALTIYTRYFGSQAKAREMFQKLFESAYVTALRKAVARRASEYAQLFPQLIEEEPALKRASLIGFDPTEIESIFVPFENVGAAGKEGATELLKEMGRRALANKEQSE